MTPKPLLTIVIPTRNRVSYLRHLIVYLEKMQCPYPILIGDSSEPAAFKQTEDILRNEGGALQIIHRAVPPSAKNEPGRGTIECMARLLDEVSTPYAVFNADDDFIIPKCLSKCVEFLETHPEYSGCHGNAILLGTDPDRLHHVKGASRYAQNAVEENLPSERLTQHLAHYTPTEYSVKRTRQIRTHWHLQRDLNIPPILGELLNSSLLVIDGKTKKLDDLYMVRCGHLQMTSVTLNQVPWLTDDSYQKHVERFCQCLTERLLANEPLSAKTAMQLIESAFNTYKRIGRQHKEKLKAPSLGKTISAPFRKSKILHSLWVGLRSTIPDAKGSMLLPALLRRTSPYYTDFLPIYQVLQHSRLENLVSGSRS